MGIESLIGGGGGGGGAAIIGAAANIYGTVMGNKWGRDAANTSMEWQEHMSNTAHQREVKDLQKAGLNPLLSVNSGASTGSGGMSNPQAPQIDMPGIMQAMVANKQLQQRQQEIDISKAATAAAIAKDQSQTELNKTNRLISEGGMLSKYLGTSGATIQQGIGKGVHKVYDALMNKQPPKMPPSSAGEINLNQP